jgi:hypothetical protein
MQQIIRIPEEKRSVENIEKLVEHIKVIPFFKVRKLNGKALFDVV